MTRGLEPPYVCIDGLEKTSGLTGWDEGVWLTPSGCFLGVLQLQEAQRQLKSEKKKVTPGGTRTHNL